MSEGLYPYDFCPSRGPSGSFGGRTRLREHCERCPRRRSMPVTVLPCRQPTLRLRLDPLQGGHCSRIHAWLRLHRRFGSTAINDLHLSICVKATLTARDPGRPNVRHEDPLNRHRVSRVSQEMPRRRLQIPLRLAAEKHGRLVAAAYEFPRNRRTHITCTADDQQSHGLHIFPPAIAAGTRLLSEHSRVWG